MKLVIRNFMAHELTMATEWAANEGWNPGLNDPASFYAADPEGFFVAEVNGQPVGCISAVRYGDRFGFLGLYIVVPSQRGKGYGLALWSRGLEYLAGRNIGLDGVVAQQANYVKSGFRLAHRNIRYELAAAGVKYASADTQPGSGAGIMNLVSVDFKTLLKYDQRHFLYPRSQFLRLWINQPDAFAVGALDSDKGIIGYAVMRPCRVGYKIGPLFADSEAIADALMKKLISHVHDGPVFLDIPEPNIGAVALVERYGMKPMFETARMYTQADPGLPLNNIYGITTFELG